MPDTTVKPAHEVEAGGTSTSMDHQVSLRDLMVPFSTRRPSCATLHHRQLKLKSGQLFSTAKMLSPFELRWKRLGRPQPPTPVILDNTTAHGFTADTIKQRRTRAIDMRYHWLRDRQTQKQFDFRWEPAANNRADYFTKHHPPSHCRDVRHYYVLATLKAHLAQAFALPLRGCANPGLYPAHARRPDGNRYRVRWHGRLGRPASSAPPNPQPRKQLII